MLCLVSLIRVGLAQLADQLSFCSSFPMSPMTLLRPYPRIITSSMLVIAVFAAGSMHLGLCLGRHRRYASCFFLVVADDVSIRFIHIHRGVHLWDRGAGCSDQRSLRPRRWLALLTPGDGLCCGGPRLRHVGRPHHFGLGRVTNTISRVEEAASRLTGAWLASHRFVPSRLLSSPSPLHAALQRANQASRRVGCL